MTLMSFVVVVGGTPSDDCGAYAHPDQFKDIVHRRRRPLERLHGCTDVNCHTPPFRPRLSFRKVQYPGVSVELAPRLLLKCVSVITATSTQRLLRPVVNISMACDLDSAAAFSTYRDGTGSSMPRDSMADERGACAAIGSSTCRQSSTTRSAERRDGDWRRRRRVVVEQH